MQKGRVKPNTGLNLRVKPNGQVVDVLHHDQEFTIIDEVTFYRIKTLSGEVGYVHGDYIEKIPGFSTIPNEAHLEGESSGNYRPEFNAVKFIDPHFVGESVTVDEDFVPELKRLASYAEQCHLQIWVTSSTRALDNQVRGAIVTPATQSCHHIGHAIDMNLMFEGKIYNSKKLSKENHPHLPQELQQFFTLVREDEKLRWGGDFSTPDPVHIDDDFYHQNKLFYQAKLNSRVDQLNV